MLQNRVISSNPTITKTTNSLQTIPQKHFPICKFVKYTLASLNITGIYYDPKAHVRLSIGGDEIKAKLFRAFKHQISIQLATKDNNTILGAYEINFN